MIEKGFENIVKKIVEERGKDILLEIPKLKSLLLDFTKNEYKKESSLFLVLINAECVKFINMTDDPCSCKTFLVNRLEEEHSISPVKSSEMLDILFFVLLGEKVPICSNIPQIGSVMQFGNYKWRILDIQKNKVLILTENVVELRSYNVSCSSVTWDTCTLRKYLNCEFLENFTDEEQKRIEESLINNNSNYWYETSGGIKTTDKIFLLSIDEADKYFGDSGDYVNKRRKIQDIGKILPDNNGYYFTNIHDSKRVIEYSRKSCWWWLRSPGGSAVNAACIYDDGGVNVYGFIVNNPHGGVRPALWLKF